LPVIELTSCEKEVESNTFYLMIYICVLSTNILHMHYALLC